MSLWNHEEQPYEIVDHGQAHAHKGNLFSANHLFGTVANGGSAVITGITGAKEAGLMILAKATGEAEIEFEKGTTFSNNGTEVAQINRNEASSRTSAATIYHTPTVDSAGTVFSHGLIPGGGGRFTKMGGETGIGAEYIIAPNSNHLTRVVNTSGSDSKVWIELIWHE